MLKLIQYSDTISDKWDEFAHKYGNIFHTTAFKNLLQECFAYRPIYHYLADANGNIKALLPVIVAKNIMQKKVGISLPFINHLDICTDGSIDRNVIIQHLQNIQQQYGLNYLQIRLREPIDESNKWKNDTTNCTFLLPLQGNEQDILALSSGSNRNHTRKVYKNNYFEVSFATSNLNAFYKVYQKRMHELGSPSPGIEFFRAFFSYFPEDAYLLTVLDKDTQQVIGGMLLLKSAADKTLYYPYGANLVAYNNKYLNNFMYFEAAKLGQSLSLNTLDLGRSPIDSGTYNFKKHWGAVPVPLHYLFHFSEQAAVIPNKDNMSVFINIWRMLPLSIANYLGARLIKNVLP